jgi:anti-anti-sigma regulatory factor
VNLSGDGFQTAELDVNLSTNLRLTEFSMSVALAARPAASIRPGALRISSERLDPSTLLVDAAGELDAANARQLVDHVASIPDSHSTLVVNLGGLTFFGTEGLWAVNKIIAASTKRHATPILVAGPADATAAHLRSARRPADGRLSGGRLDGGALGAGTHAVARMSARHREGG